jgi:hypothetical protein
MTAAMSLAAAPVRMQTARPPRPTPTVFRICRLGHGELEADSSARSAMGWSAEASRVGEGDR